MTRHTVSVQTPENPVEHERELAYRIATVAAEGVPVSDEAAEMVKCRIIDNAAVALAAFGRPPVASARDAALAHPRAGGATLYGVEPSIRVEAEWAAWANAVAVRELDFHDTFLAADYCHPGDNIGPLIAVAQQMQCGGRALLRAVTTAYEIQVDLAKSISLHRWGIDHMAHLCPASVSGIGSLLELPVDVVYQAVNQAVHTSFSTRQSRKGAISSWKAYVPGHSAFLAVMAVDRAMRGESAPAPVYEGEDGVMVRMLDGPEARYEVPLPDPGEERRAILETYTKEYSAEYQAQAVIDIAFRLRRRIADPMAIDEVVIRTSHHTHKVIGTGSGDPQKFDPDASRETLDHSVMYIFAVALVQGRWHHETSYSSETRHDRTVDYLWRRVRTEVSEIWERRYHSERPEDRAFGATVELRLIDGNVLTEELSVADAHPNGARPFGLPDYIRKFEQLTEGIVEEESAAQFLDAVRRLPELSPDELRLLTPSVHPEVSSSREARTRGIF